MGLELLGPPQCLVMKCPGRKAEEGKMQALVFSFCSLQSHYITQCWSLRQCGLCLYFRLNINRDLQKQLDRQNYITYKETNYKLKDTNKFSG